MASNCDLYMSNSKFPSFESFKFPKLQIHPHILPLLPKGPETQLQLIPSQVAPKTEGPKSGLQKPGVSAKGPLAPWKAPRHSEEESASKGTPQKGPKERPQEAGNPGAPNRATKETSKPLGPHLKAPQPRPQGSSAKGDSKVTTKAKQ